MCWSSECIFSKEEARPYPEYTGSTLLLAKKTSPLPPLLYLVICACVGGCTRHILLPRIPPHFHLRESDI
ncbi:hypothetical protein GJ744_007921 [Endocarpon pusillum]|uniref:Uncharacterized protein n=1 Tax=Endocarpon pusillum TaxID=364733 RepID=A0A8H7AM08_9EURO|nr:hypothetical protein GJ744_007921 [Endocarpon pusillum]